MNIQYSTYSTHKDVVQYTHVQYTRILYSTHVCTVHVRMHLKIFCYKILVSFGVKFKHTKYYLAQVLTSPILILG